ncbi:L,D-transpeptidase family protein [Streptomyces sp. V3I7]|uniref:L,D-transpeptidase family protein n=1 Tax=Streptomyces sp. V3I7 TaxID=3042278 RepID=UPI0027D7A9EB|nr:L,D-transpeptidase family protein [Streptomyces sp. V3I7]
MRTSTVTLSSLRSMRCGGARHFVSVAVACGVLLATMTACGVTGVRTSPAGAPGTNNPASATQDAPLPGVGERMWQRVPSGTRQVVVVYGEGRNSADSLVALYEQHGTAWERTGSWPAHNGRMGWTTDHRLDDERSPVGVFTLTDAGGALRSPGSRLPYWYDDNAFTATLGQADREYEAYGEDEEDGKGQDAAFAHAFDYVIAIDYNRLKGAPPYDWSRPDGVEKGGGIWLHLDHGAGTSGCVSLPEPGMKTLLRTLDPVDHPVVVMGDRERLGS